VSCRRLLRAVSAKGKVDFKPPSPLRRAGVCLTLQGLQFANSKTIFCNAATSRRQTFDFRSQWRCRAIGDHGFPSTAEQRPRVQFQCRPALFRVTAPEEKLSAMRLEQRIHKLPPHSTPRICRANPHDVHEHPIRHGFRRPHNHCRRSQTSKQGVPNDGPPIFLAWTGFPISRNLCELLGYASTSRISCSPSHMGLCWAGQHLLGRFVPFMSGFDERKSSIKRLERIAALIPRSCPSQRAGRGPMSDG
jgi:hypothetical protein